MEFPVDEDLFYDEEETKKKQARKERRRQREHSKIPKDYIPNQREFEWYLVNFLDFKR